MFQPKVGGIWAIKISLAYDRFIILVDGTYDIVAQTLTNVMSWVAMNKN